jgi:formate hydrogenlyase subunit 6/NADH:ubiquinone oxidoreductase subunit I
MDRDDRILPKQRFDDLIRLLGEEGFEVVGPRIDQDAIVYAPVHSASDLPIGWTDYQAPGFYRLKNRGDKAHFGFAVGPHSWKKYLFPSVLNLWKARRTPDGFEIEEEQPEPPRRAFLGIRSCELHALAIQDRVFIDREGRYTDPYYARARERLFLIAVECEHPGGTCFCASMGTGPEVQPDRIPPLASKHDKAPKQAETSGSTRVSLPLTAQAPSNAAAISSCDLILTELDDVFVVRSASSAGQRLIDRLGLPTSSSDQAHEARQRVQAAAGSMGRTVDVADIRNLLHGNQNHPRWDDVAKRCLACTNCTMVCPTCFCSSTEDVADLSFESAERVRRWDSCFNPEFSRVHGGNFRPSIRGRYRQWLTHKFASWFDQFDVSGCVGCGRCITWCPVEIDVTQEIAAIRQTDRRQMENKT